MARSRRPSKRSSRGRRAAIVTAAVLALPAAGIALAGQGPATTTLVSATFSANTVAASHSQACTGANNDSYTITDAIYTGTASSGDTRLAGPLAIDVRSVYDSTTNIGSLVGEFEIRGTSSSQPGLLRASLSAVDVNGSVQGYLIGTPGSGAHFLGSFSSTFSAGSGFGSSSAPGTIGSGGGTNTAVITSGGCTRLPSPPEPSPGGDGAGFPESGHQGSGRGHHQD